MLLGGVRIHSCHILRARAPSRNGENAYVSPSIVVLSGGVGGSRFVRGVRDACRQLWPDGSGGSLASVTVVANTGDDLWLTGVRLQPDVDSLIYTLAGINDPVRGWGRVGESERVSGELRAWGAGWPWFTLGDLDLAAHLSRTGWLRDGLTVSEVVSRLSARWPLGVRILPMSDDEADTHVLVEGDRIHFQEWWTRYRAELPALGFDHSLAESSSPAPGVLDAIAGADMVLIAPSNPIVSIGPILAVPGIADALRAAGGPVVGVSPIIAGAPVRGMADACLNAVGVETSADAVGHHYGARGVPSGQRGGLLDVWIVAEEDASLAPRIAGRGLQAEVRPLWMRDAESGARLASDAIHVALARIEGSGARR